MFSRSMITGLCVGWVGVDHPTAVDHTSPPLTYDPAPEIACA